MPCYQSSPAWQNTVRNPNGKADKRITFKPPAEYRPPDYWLPCGTCEGCAERKKKDWSIRMYHESQLFDRNCFATFTYDEEHYPEDGKINKRHLQNFIKRLQRDQKKVNRPIRYYAVGEYGEQTNRAHYHLILFNEDFLSSRYYYALGGDFYGNKELEEIWGMGQIHLAPFNAGRAFYTAGYVAKKLADKEQETFQLQSRQPPLGMNWVRQNYKSMAAIKKIIIEGQEYPVPRVYAEWMKGTPEYYALRAAAQENVQVLTDYQLASKREHYLARKGQRSEKI